MLIPLLPEDEQEKHNEWFLSIMKYSNTFKDMVQHWLNCPEESLEKIVPVHRKSLLCLQSQSMLRLLCQIIYKITSNLMTVCQMWGADHLKIKGQLKEGVSSLSSLPKRDLKVFDGDPIQYHAFMRAFENSVESKTDNYSVCLYFLEQYTVGRPRELIQSCQHIDPCRGHIRAKSLLQEHFGNEQKVASAYMNKALSWPQIKVEDVIALQEYSLFLRGCGNVMEEVQYMYDLDMPINMMHWAH